jgi:hypothetical protein
VELSFASPIAQAGHQTLWISHGLSQRNDSSYSGSLTSWESHIRPLTSLSALENRVDLVHKTRATNHAASSGWRLKNRIHLRQSSAQTEKPRFSHLLGSPEGSFGCDR